MYTSSISTSTLIVFYTTFLLYDMLKIFLSFIIKFQSSFVISLFKYDDKIVIILEMVILFEVLLACIDGGPNAY